MAEDPHENNQNQNRKPGNGLIESLANISIENGDVNAAVQAYAEEYENIDHTLDEIDSWMNKLEEQNDSLFAELDDLLESSRQARKELQQQKEETESQQSAQDEKQQDSQSEK